MICTARELRRKGRALIGQLVATPRMGSWGGGLCEVIRLGTDRAAPEIVFHVRRLSDGEEIGVFAEEVLRTLSCLPGGSLPRCARRLPTPRAQPRSRSIRWTHAGGRRRKRNNCLRRTARYLRYSFRLHTKRKMRAFLRGTSPARKFEVLHPEGPMAAKAKKKIAKKKVAKAKKLVKKVAKGAPKKKAAKKVAKKAASKKRAGAAKGGHKLDFSASDVQYIRARCYLRSRGEKKAGESNDLSQAALAQKFKCSTRTIFAIATKQTYAEVADAEAPATS